MKKIITIATVLFSMNLFSQGTLPSGFVNQQVGRFEDPVSMYILPDGRILFPNQKGKLFVMENGIFNTTPILSLDSIYFGNEKGFLGVVSDPNFTTNGYIYCYYTITVTGNNYKNNTLVRTGNPLKNPIMHKIARYTMSGNTVLSGSKTTILNMDITPGAVINVNHDGGTMLFGSDGKLYVATGEGDLWCPCFTPISTGCNWACPIGECPGIDPTDGCITYQWATNRNTFFGKILRLNADGTAPNDNPFSTSPAPVLNAQRYFYAMGFRNPFTMTFRPGTNDLYINDVGSSGTGKSEEINKLTSTSGKNFGWPKGEGMQNLSAYQDPIFRYSDYISSNPSFNIVTNTGCAITGGAFSPSTGSNWPTQYRNKYFFIDFCNGWINILDVDNGNTRTNFATGLVNNFGNAVSGMGILNNTFDANGNMYYLLRSSVNNLTLSGLYKISYQPITVSGITISGSNQVTGSGNTVQFSAGVQPANATDLAVLWSTSPSTIANINANGLMTPIRDGVVTITAIASGNSSVSASMVVTISGQTTVSGITLTSTGNSFSITTNGQTLQLGAIVTPSNASNLNYNLVVFGGSAGVVVTITSTNLLSSLGTNGVVTIVGISSLYPTITDRRVITITGQSALSIQISVSGSGNATTISTNKGTLQMVETVFPANTSNKSVTWSTDLTSIATISGTGLLQAVSNGIVRVTATSVPLSNISGFADVTVSGQVVSSIQKKSNNPYDEIYKIYPNPAKGILNVDILKNIGNLTCAIYTIQGNEVYSTIFGASLGKHTINISNLAPGMYKIALVGDNGAYYYKLMVE